jgi:hypothetical protein
MRPTPPFFFALALTLAIGARSARADDPVPGDDAPLSEEEVAIEEARAAFHRGNELVARSDWAAALEAFEESHRLHPHPVTRYNVGVAYRALGRYTRARQALRAALGAEGPDALPPSLAEQARSLLEESESIVVRAKLTVKPAVAHVAVDGRPLEVEDRRTFVAGTRPAGKGEPVGEGAVEVILDPGPHVFLFSRKGFSDAVVNKTFRPGAKEDLAIALDRLPATIHVAAAQKSARVTIDGADVGFAPVDVPRPAGTYQVEVTKDGHVPFSTRVTLEPGGESRLRAPLPPRETPLVEEWWFWTLTGVATTAAVTGVAVGTYFATREEPSAPPPDGGSLGWVIDFR